MANYKIEVIQTYSDFLLKEKEWRQFENSINKLCVTQCYDFLSTYWKYFKDDPNPSFGFKRELYIIFLYHEEELVAIAPFCILHFKIKRIFTLRSVQFIGQQYFSNYCDIICDQLTKEKFDIIFEWLYQNKKFDIITLKFIPEYSLISDFNKCFIHAYTSEFSTSSYADYADYSIKNYSKHFRNNFRNDLNRIKNDGYIFDPQIKDFSLDDMDEIMRLAKSKKKDNKYSIYENPVQNQIAIEIYNKFKAKVIFVKFKSTSVAYNVNFYFRNTKFVFDASFDRDYRFYSLGIVTMDFNIRDTFINKYDEHILGWGEDHYKSRIMKTSTMLFHLLKKGNTIFSNLLFMKKKRMALNYQQELINRVTKTKIKK
jgi:hypothetical protein